MLFAYKKVDPRQLVAFLGDLIGQFPYHLYTSSDAHMSVM